MAHEEYLVWQDAKRYSLRPRARTHQAVPTLRLCIYDAAYPREEYDGAADGGLKIKLKR